LPVISKLPYEIFPTDWRTTLSHIVTVKSEVRDAAAVKAACQRLGLADPVQGKTKLFSGEVEGLAVKLPDWVYPVVCDTASGQIKFDNFGGRWGDQKHLDRFIQAYAAEKVKIESRRKGHVVTESQLADGSIKLTIQVGGAA
jgi:hypothetical protein